MTDLLINQHDNNDYLSTTSMQALVTVLGKVRI